MIKFIEVPEQWTEKFHYINVDHIIKIESGHDKGTYIMFSVRSYYTAESILTSLSYDKVKKLINE